MLKIIQYELDGVSSCEITKHVDDRGFFAEILRQDWREFLGNDQVVQAALSVSEPGLIRAWHRHVRGQIDYMVVLNGTVKIAAYDDREGSLTRGKIAEITVSGNHLQIVRIPGYYWHGTKNVGNQSSTTMYFFTKLYDYTSPDEERRLWDDETIIDPQTLLPYKWNG